MILTEYIELGGLAVMYPDDILFSITLPQLALFCCGLPAAAFVICVLLSLMLHFEGATKTHCNVPNYLPSISAAIGDYTPERYVWRFCIALHCLPRLMAAIAYKNFYLRSPMVKMSNAKEKQSYITYSRGFYDLLCYLICIFHLVENFFLLALTVVSSTENHGK
uniref:CWH43-like N-terminal domain-containing protein n=1 Tax=Romanomermis culicivorax TaxID=13658 RepID=A0A915J8P7_ROMCU